MSTDLMNAPWKVRVELGEAHKINNRRGAPMGRSDELPEDVKQDIAVVELTLTRLLWIDGDYDSGGAYWGSGMPCGQQKEWDYIYMAQGEFEDERVRIFTRAKNRADAWHDMRCVLVKAVLIPNPERKRSPYKPANEFAAAYIKTMLWITNDNSDPDTGGDPLDENFDGKPGEFGPGVWDSIIDECAKFQKENAVDLACEGVTYGPDYGQEGRAGHDFFLTRCGHGAGFWDGDWPKEEGKRLTEASQRYGEIYVYVGDDGKLYI